MRDGTGTVILQCLEMGCWLHFSRPLEVVAARHPDEVQPAMRRIDEAVSAHRLFAAGFVSYEAAPGCDRALKVRRSPDLPLAWFGIYRDAETVRMQEDFGASLQPLAWTATVSREEYESVLHDLKGRIAAGDTYQVNYTYRLRAPFNGDPRTYFGGLAGGGKAGYAAFVDAGRWAVCSASPELFFRVKDGTLVSRPMKGTASRGRTLREDDEHTRWLQGSEKNRAENIMIVDMIRNDVGRIAEIGSAKVPRLCEVERFPTVYGRPWRGTFSWTVTSRGSRRAPCSLTSHWTCPQSGRRWTGRESAFGGRTTR